MSLVLVTGATGFVGRPLCDSLAQAGYSVCAALHRDRAVSAHVAQKVVVGDIGATTDWKVALSGVESVIHVAARAHVLNDAADGEQAYMETNARGTQSLAEAAARAGVRRFIYLSTVKVNGEETTGHAFTRDDEPRPQDAYGLSKWFGEKLLFEAAAATGMEVTVVRSPLVFGVGVRANFLRLLRYVDRGVPLPLGAVKNSRSFVSVWNLCDLLVNLLKNPAAPGRTWMVSDGEDLSTPQLIARLGHVMGRRVRLFPVPVGMLQLCGSLMGRKAEIARLCGSLVVDMRQTRDELGWTPPIETDDALARTVAWYLSEGRARGH
jgi:nucleoside-diphosphate-sugar epimerase